MLGKKWSGRTRQFNGVMLIIAVAASFLTLLMSTATYADDSALTDATCQTLDTGCTADAPVPTTPDTSYHILSGLSLNWTEDQSNDTFQVCASVQADMSSPSCENTSQLSVSATDLIQGTNTDGTWYWQVTAFLSGGVLSQSTASAIQSTIVDTPPTVTLTMNGSATPADVGNGATVAIHGQATDTSGSSCSISVTNGDGNVVAGPYDCTATNDFEWSTAGLPSDTYTATITASDATMNASSQPAITTGVVLVVDNSGPTVTIGNDGVLFDDGSVTPDLTADDPHGPSTYAWSDDGMNPQDVTYDATAQNPSFTPTVDGDYVFTVVVSDAFGNQTTQKFHFTYWSDIPVLTAPTDPTTLTTEAVVPTDTTMLTGGGTASSTSADATTSRVGDDDDSTPAAASTLGASTIATVVAADPGDGSALVATHRGWQIFGVLWYWWALLIILGIVIYTIVRRRLSRRTIQSI